MKKLTDVEKWAMAEIRSWKRLRRAEYRDDVAMAHTIAWQDAKRYAAILAKTRKPQDPKGGK